MYKKIYILKKNKKTQTAHNEVAEKVIIAHNVEEKDRQRKKIMI